MSESCYLQYAFTGRECRTEEIGPGVDPRYPVELVDDGRIAALTSRVGLDEFALERLQGQTPEDVRWLGEVAARHNEIICQAAASSAVLPLRLGTMFQTRDSLKAMLERCRSAVTEFLERFGNRQEWGVKLYVDRRRLERVPGHAGPPPPHYLKPEKPGLAYLTQKRSQIDRRREVRASVDETIRQVEQCLAVQAEHCCRIRNLPNELTGRTDEMVFNAAFLLPSSIESHWLETVEQVGRDMQDKGLVLEVTGPWPPYHFCPTLES